MSKVTGPPASVAVGVPNVQAVPARTFRSAGATSVGGVVSTTVTVWLHWAALPQASAARHVRVMSTPPAEASFVVVLMMVTGMVMFSPTSNAFGSSKLQSVPISMVLAAAQLSVGASSSVTMTVWEQTALLPEGSVPRQDRRAVRLAPQVELVVVDSMSKVTRPPASVAVGVPKVQAVPARTFRSAGTTSVGGVVSTMVTVWLHWAALPQASAARQVRVMSTPPAEASFVVVLMMVTGMVMFSPTSNAFGSSKLQSVPISMVLAAAQLSIGASSSVTMTVWEQTALLPEGSVPRQDRRATRLAPQA